MDPNDPRYPMAFSKSLEWTFTIVCAFSTLGVSLASSAYAGGTNEVISSFDVSTEVATLGVSLFVLGFAVGTLIWAPLSELYGRQIVFLVSYLGLAVFCAGATGGIIADVFAAEDRGLAMNLFAGAPFLGPTLGPIIGGFLGENAGWVWVQGFLATFTGLIWIVEALVIPETYGPVLLRKRAAKLSNITGKVYVSTFDLESPQITTTEAFATALGRP
ncbi:hypothetical protein TCE0_033f09553 [Talaromyces pinophilus]|uniref:Major facilitator superfamily (MFS) profile domain-containing protein n=1 Tax=Talaromyces pinophilus TaxID=128442 RepID=A0A6V8HDY0_TALPI|nr:hypothetical protein TCE0_033f09553 [Talaromyces pinophilus]